MRPDDRVELKEGIVGMPIVFREIARLANQAGLEGYHIAAVDVGYDVEAMRTALNAGLYPAPVQRVLITYVARV